MYKKLYAEEIALARELRAEGIDYQHIAAGLGCSTAGLSLALADGRPKRPAGVIQKARTRIINHVAARELGVKA